MTLGKRAFFDHQFSEMFFFGEGEDLKLSKVETTTGFRRDRRDSTFTPLKTNMTLEKSSCFIGNTSSTGPFSIAMLVYQRVSYFPGI